MALSITSQLIMAAAERRGWQATVVSPGYSMYRLDLPDGRQFYVRVITSIKSATVNNVITDRKDLFYELLESLQVQVPATMRYRGDWSAALAFLHEHQTIVVKPTDQAHGKGVTIDITTEDQLQTAVDYAAGFGKKLLLQQQITGTDQRLLYIGGQLAAAVIRQPAAVTGDGRHTVAELIAIENASDQRGPGYERPLSYIDVDSARRYLGDRMDEVPPAGQAVQVVGVANIGRGGVSIDITDSVDPALLATSQKVIDHFGIGLCGIDYLVTSSGEAYLIEINTGPSLGLHEYPSQGKPRGTPDKFLDWLAG